jgi:hypothetical protein
MLAILLAAAALPPGTKLLDSISEKQVTVLPIVRTAHPPSPGAITLKQGLSDKLVTVREHGDVNSVVVDNHGAQPLLLVGGEMILGGQQDRIIGQDVLIQPHHAQTVTVYCVEHGRWSGAGQFGAAGGLVDARVRTRAKVAKDQQQVWDEVAKKAEQVSARTPTGTYRAVGEKTKAAVQPVREAIVRRLDALPEAGELVGLAAAVNGRIVSVDAFATPALFAQYRDRILDAAIVGAQGVAEDRKAPRASPATVYEFMNKANTSIVRDEKGAPVYENALPAEF